jgi:hypothetical protein
MKCAKRAARLIARLTEPNKWGERLGKSKRDLLECSVAFKTPLFKSGILPFKLGQARKQVAR